MKKTIDLVGQDVLFRDIPCLTIPAGKEECSLCGKKNAIVCRTEEGGAICDKCWNTHLAQEIAESL